MSYIGYGEAAGVDYSHVTQPFAAATRLQLLHRRRRVLRHAEQLGDRRRARRRRRPSSCRRTAATRFTRYFGVGDGSGGNAVDLENAIKRRPSATLRGCVTIGGAPAPQARVSVGPLHGDGAIASVTLGLRHRRRRLLRRHAACRATTASPARATARPTKAAARHRWSIRSASSPATAPCRTSPCPPPGGCASRWSTRTAPRCRHASASSASIPAPTSSSRAATSPGCSTISGKPLPVRLCDGRVHRLGRRRRLRRRARQLRASSPRAASSTRCSSSRSPSRAGAPVEVDGADRARRRHHRLRLLRLPRARHRQRRLARRRPRPREAVRRRGGRQHHHDRPPRPHRPDADHRAPRLHAFRPRHDRRGDHHLGLRPLQRLPADHRSDAGRRAARPTGRAPPRRAGLHRRSAPTV